MHISREMREKLTHFSREIARNARNQMYPFLTKLRPNLINIWAIFKQSNSYTIKKFEMIQILQFFKLSLQFMYFLKHYFKVEIKSWKKTHDFWFVWHLLFA